VLIVLRSKLWYKCYGDKDIDFIDASEGGGIFAVQKKLMDFYIQLYWVTCGNVSLPTGIPIRSGSKNRIKNIIIDIVEGRRE